jgi:hypothetical protein
MTQPSWHTVKPEMSKRSSGFRFIHYRGDRHPRLLKQIPSQSSGARRVRRIDELLEINDHHILEACRVKVFPIDLSLRHARRCPPVSIPQNYVPEGFCLAMSGVTSHGTRRESAVALKLAKSSITSLASMISRSLAPAIRAMVS